MTPPAAPLILRRPPLGEILASAHDVGREYRVLAGLSAAGLRVPRPIAICDDHDVTGAPFYAMEHVAGEVLSKVETAERLSPEARGAVGVGLARTLAEFHAQDVDALGLGDFRRPESLVSRQLRRWHRQWEGSKTRELPVIDELAALFATQMPEEHEVVLVHGDYHLGNALVGLDGSLLAILDWELCSTGDPLADVGLMVAYWGEFGAAARRRRRPLPRAGDRPARVPKRFRPRAVNTRMPRADHSTTSASGSRSRTGRWRSSSRACIGAG